VIEGASSPKSLRIAARSVNLAARALPAIRAAMADERILAAMERIDTAVARVESAARRSGHAGLVEDGGLRERHENLRSRIEAAVAEIDTLIRNG